MLARDVRPFWVIIAEPYDRYIATAFDFFKKFFQLSPQKKLYMTSLILTCGNKPFYGIFDSEGQLENPISYSNSCNDNCNCYTNQFSPVCDLETNVSYFSPCHAGCSRSANDVYTNCDCLGDGSGSSTLVARVLKISFHGYSTILETLYGINYTLYFP